jgi:hypothetical protein
MKEDLSLLVGMTTGSYLYSKGTVYRTYGLWSDLFFSSLGEPALSYNDFLESSYY